ncbi:hypothetical protein [Kitasatospora sp. cg17-2]
MLRRTSSVILGASFLLASALGTGTALAGTTRTASCGGSFTIFSNEGMASIQYCDGGTSVIGTVYDTAADGRCPRVEAKQSNGSWRTSDWAGPKGDTSPVNLYASPGLYFVDVKMGYISC